MNLSTGSSHGFLEVARTYAPLSGVCRKQCSDLGFRVENPDDKVE